MAFSTYWYWSCALAISTSSASALTFVGKAAYHRSQSVQCWHARLQVQVCNLWGRISKPSEACESHRERFPDPQHHRELLLYGKWNSSGFSTPPSVPKAPKVPSTSDTPVVPFTFTDYHIHVGFFRINTLSTSSWVQLIYTYRQMYFACPCIKLTGVIGVINISLIVSFSSFF